MIFKIKMVIEVGFSIGKTMDEYWNARHEHELTRHKESYLYLDDRHAGIGSDMAWGSEINEKHLIPAGVYSYRFMIATM